MTQKYQPQQFEKKWIEYWEKEKIYKTNDGKKKQYILDMFPYPSAAGLHVGHPRGYTGSDIIGRYYRMNGYAVLHPMGWDAFGLPAENAAIKAKKNPMDMVPEHIANFKRQMQMLGFSYDWEREFSTTDPEYYKWTQWLFIQFYNMGLLYKKDTPINFCPFCKTGLAEEEVLANGTHERCGTKIIKKELPQWIFKITKYADRLLEDLEGLDWPKGILEMQKNWIGRSEGVLIEFRIQSAKLADRIPIFTTRPETTDGTTFLVLAPEHPFVASLLNSKLKTQKSKLEGIKKYVEAAKRKTEEAKKKTGVFTGLYAINPVTNKEIPIWIADYVMSTYATGGVMGVPAADKRDFEFAKSFNLPIVKTSFKAKPQGKRKITYHLHDWIFSRQRYWGEPIPMIYCQKDDWMPVPEDELPIKLPYVKSYEPIGTGESPLAKIKDWVNTICPKCGGRAKRETDTMPNWAGSCWYFLAFAFDDIKGLSLNKDSPCIKQWLPVDWYLGGAEHAVLHLLYSRFWVKALYDLKLLDFKEPFLRLRNQGMILAENHRKMSKSFGNVINPDAVVDEYGADTLRVYEMFMAPFSQEIAWSTKALQGAYRFLKRIWEIYQSYKSEILRLRRTKSENNQLVIKLQKTIAKVTGDITDVKFNTAIAAMMEFLNEWEKITHSTEAVEYGLSQQHAKQFLQILAPFAPFTTEEIWYEVFGEKNSIHLSTWPKVEGKIVEEEVVIPVQVNGKLRDTIKTLSINVAEKVIVKEAIKSQKIKKYLAGKKYKVIYVEGKILNFVVK